MAKFEVEFELTGLKLRMKGERGDIPALAASIGKQVENLIKPIATAAEPAAPQLPLPIPANTIDVVSQVARKRRSGRVRSDSSNAQPASAAPVADVNVDPATWGTPQQTWKTLDKAVWLLFVMENNGGPSEMTSADIERIFNAKYRTAKTILRPNVNRDLMKVKVGDNALVGRNDRNDAWFLTEKGKQHAVDLISKVREKATANN